MKYSGLLLLLCLAVISGISQTGTTALPTTLSPATASKYLDLLTSKFSRLQNSIEKQTNKALQKLQKQEAKLYKQLAKKIQPLPTVYLNSNRQSMLLCKSNYTMPVIQNNH